MATPIFRVDLSKTARDFQPTATEPGLAMLDRQGVNYAILKRWFGELIAEPQWEGEDTICFFVRDAERRLEQVDVRPTTKADLEGALSEQLQAIRSKIKKIKPESSTEMLLHRVIKQAFTNITNDLAAGDHDSYFFKYRSPDGTWHLVWCWGYHRSDTQLAPAQICSTPDCGHLYVRRPKQKALCPLCNTASRRSGGLLARVPAWLLLLLLLLLGGLAYFGQPKLVATPANWSGPTGSRVEFHVEKQSWFFFREDVTPWVLAQSHDSRVLELDEHSAVGHAKNLGHTMVSLRFRNHITDALIEVLPPAPPQTLTIEPQQVELAIGSTAKLKAVGHYEDGKTIDLTDITQWRVENTSLATFFSGGIEGVTAGETTIQCRFPTPPDVEPILASAPLTVVDAPIESIAVRLSPEAVGLGQHSRIEVDGLGTDGNTYALMGSSLLSLSVTPQEIATVDGEYLEGKQEGTADLLVTYRDLTETVVFMVGEWAHGDVFAVAPAELELIVHEYFDLDVVTPSDAPIESVSSDSEIVEVVGPTQLAGRMVGEATVTVTQGGNQQTVHVTVREGTIQSIVFDPEVMSVPVGDSARVGLYGVLEDGSRVSLSPDSVTWVRQPTSEHTLFNRAAMEVIGLKPTELPDDFEVLYNDTLKATALVEVVGDEAVGIAAIDEFGAHPPVGILGAPLQAGSLVGDGLLYRGDEVVVGDVDPFGVLGAVPEGAVITGVNGNDLTVLDAGGVRTYFSDNPLALGDVVDYRLADGTLSSMTLGAGLGAIQDVKLINVASLNLTPTEFNADVQLLLRQQAEYRLSDADGNPLSEWERYGPNQNINITSSAIARTPDDEYEIFVDRKINDIIKRFQIPFKLAAEGSN